MKSKALFAHTPPIMLFFIAALPGAISMLASSLYSILDGVFIGNFLGETAFAALNLAMPFVIINFALADLIGVGSSVLIATCLGRKQEDKANNLFTSACVMIVATGTLVGGVLFAAAPFLMRMMGAEGEFAQYAVQYLQVSALCSPVTTIVFAMDNFLRISGKIRLSMVLNILMSILGAGFEFIFLFVFDLGIVFAALATSLGMGICAVLAIIPFARGGLQLRFCKPHFTAKMIRQIISCGSPNFLNNIAGRVTSILMNLILVRFGGETAVSIYGVLMYTESVVQPLMYGMCDSLQPAVSYNWGAGDYKRVKRIEKCCFTASGILSIAAAVIIFVFPVQIASLFVANSSTEFMEILCTALRLFGFTYITRWFSFATQSYLLAIGKSLPASVISVSTAFIFPVLLIVLLWPLGLTGIWLNFALTSALAGVVSAVCLLRLRKEMNALCVSKSQEPAKI